MLARAKRWRGWPRDRQQPQELTFDANKKGLLVLRPLTGEFQFIRQTGFPRFGHVLLSVEPSSKNGLSFQWDVLPEQIPEMFREAVYRGVNRSFEAGAQFGEYAPDGLLVRVIGGSFHETDSNEGSFEIASMQAFVQALATPSPSTSCWR